MLHDIADRDWFELQFNPELAKLRGIPVPGIPSEQDQVSFTGLTGRQNLEQACSFYKLAHEAAELNLVQDPHILDFGGGWGRIARFWLRDTPPQNITVSDTMDTAISLLCELKAPYHIVKNPPFPPADYDRSYDLIYAFSVFSHLSEKYAAAWVDYLLTHLKPHGRFVFTTRGDRFISDITTIKAQTEEFVEAQTLGGASAYLKQLRATFPDPSILRVRYDAGQFQFFPLTHTRLPEDCTGETIIPRGWFEKRYGDHLVGFEQNADAQQAIVTLRR
jgi:hypothetical protein